MTKREPVRDAGGRVQYTTRLIYRFHIATDPPGSYQLYAADGIVAAAVELKAMGFNIDELAQQPHVVIEARYEEA